MHAEDSIAPKRARWKPLGAIAQHPRDLALQRCDPSVKIGDHRIERFKCALDLDWPLEQGVALVGGLGAQLLQGGTHTQALAQFVIDGWWRCPAWQRPSAVATKQKQRLRIARIGLCTLGQ